MDQMLRSMTLRQFQEWMAYAELEPFDETRDDLRAGKIVQAIWNTTPRRPGSPPVKLKDCVLSFDKREVRTPEEIQAEVLNTMGMLMLIYNDPPAAEQN